MTLLLDDSTVREVFSWTGAASALRKAYAADIESSRFPARGMARGDQAWLRTLSGAPGDSGLMGLKSIAAALGSSGSTSRTLCLDSCNIAAITPQITQHRASRTKILRMPMRSRPPRPWSTYCHC